MPEGLFDNLDEPVEEGKTYEIPLNRWLPIACCSCSLVHQWRFRVKDGRLYAKLQVDARSTAQRRRHGHGELFGEHPKWIIKEK